MTAFALALALLPDALQCESPFARLDAALAAWRTIETRREATP